MPPLPPFPMEMPRPPQLLEQLTEEQLRALEGIFFHGTDCYSFGTTHVLQVRVVLLWNIG